FLCGVARHPLFQVTADATDDSSDYRRPDYGWREQDPNQCSDRDPSPRAVLRGLLVLIDVDLALGGLDDDRHIVGSDQLVRMEIQQGVVVGLSSRLVGVGRSVNEDRPVTHVCPRFWL